MRLSRIAERKTTPLLYVCLCPGQTQHCSWWLLVLLLPLLLTRHTLCDTLLDPQQMSFINYVMADSQAISHGRLGP
jgi:hypothetical protein